MATSESARAFQQSRTPEQRRETALKRWTNKSPEERTAIAMKIVAARTPNLMESQAKRNRAWQKKTPAEKAQISAQRIATKALHHPPKLLCSTCSIHPRISKVDSYCRECRREWFAKRNYGLSAAQYQQVMSERTCFLCGNPNLRFHIDHDHATDEIRGLLCHFCNWFVAHIERIGAEAVHKAIRYVNGEHMHMKPDFPQK